MSKKNKNFLIALSEHQHALIKKRAEELGISMSEYIRRRVFVDDTKRVSNEYPAEY